MQINIEYTSPMFDLLLLPEKIDMEFTKTT